MNKLCFVLKSGSWYYGPRLCNILSGTKYAPQLSGDGVSFHLILKT